MIHSSPTNFKQSPKKSRWKSQVDGFQVRNLPFPGAHGWLNFMMSSDFMLKRQEY